MDRVDAMARISRWIYQLARCWLEVLLREKVDTETGQLKKTTNTRNPPDESGGFFDGDKLTELSAKQLQTVDAIRDVESAAMQLAEDLKYPVDAHNRILDMNHLPDVSVTLVYHLIRRGWRPTGTPLIKAKRVVGAGYYEDLVTYVDVNESDEPVVVKRQPETQEPWSVKPTVNVIDEPRSDD